MFALWVACSSPATPELPKGPVGPPDGGPGAQTFTPQDTDDPCLGMSRRGCMSTLGCILERDPASPYAYVCHKAMDACEAAFFQSEFWGVNGTSQAAEAHCKGKDGCRFDAGTDYCPCKGYGSTSGGDLDAQPCTCARGGGQPPRCLASP